MYLSVSLTSYIGGWLSTFKETTVKQSTYDRLLTSVKALEGFTIASMPIDAITSLDIQKYVNDLTKRGYGLSTIKKQMRIVTAPLKQAAALHQIPANPAVGIRLPARCNVQKPEQAAALHQIPANPAIGIRLPARCNVQKPEQTAEAYSPEEQEALSRVLSTRTRRGYAAIALMMETGLRVGEALALRWRDVQLSRKRLTVRATVVRLANKKQSFVQNEAKSESSNRAIPLTPRAVSLLSELQEGRENEWVFSGEDGQRLSYEALRYQTGCACREAKVEYRGEHVFRHTFATNCYYKGVDAIILSKLLGHADVNITYNIYIHLYGDGFDEMYASLVGDR